MAKVTQRILDKVTTEANALAEPLGLEVQRVCYVREAGIWYLRVALRRPNGESVSLTDCEQVHRPLSKRLDELDPIPGAYYLEVTSPGPDTESELTDGQAHTPLQEEELK